MNTTRHILKSLPRSVRPVELPGGGTVHVRAVTLAELRAVDRRAEELPVGPEREIRRLLLLALYALSEPDGSAAFDGAADADLVEVEDLSPDQLNAIAAGAVPSTDDAKKS